MTDFIAADFDLEDEGTSRRRFLMAAGATGAAAAAVMYLKPSAAGASSGARRVATPRSAPKQMPSAETDLDTAAFAASLEVLAVATYKAALDAANSGALGPVPPAGANFVTSAISQHQTYLDTLNTTLTGAGRPAVTEPDPTLKATVDSGFAKVKDFVGAASLARDLEEISSATYLKAIPTLTPDTAKLAGSVLCVGQQRVATLNFVLGDYPVPEVFATTTKAASPS